MTQIVRATAAIVALAFIAYPTFAEGPLRDVSHVLPQLLPRPTATVVFGGDMLFDRTIRGTMEEKGQDYIFLCLDPVFSAADLVVANLEGPITELPSMSLGSVIGSPENFTFTFPTYTGELLARHNVQLVNLGNNHILNFGWDGARSTLEYLRAADVGYFGDPLEKRVAREDVNGVKLAFVNYNEFAPGGWKDSASTTIREVRAALDDGYVPVVYAHWGDEYSAEPPERVREFARAFVDAGATLVVGSHPHVVQPHEVYLPAGRQVAAHIYYSVGNLFFDQYWSDMVRNGLLLRASFTASSVSVEEIPIELLRTRQTCPMAS